jgi:hypothetical protein
LRAEEPDLLRAEVLACLVRLVVLLRGRDAPLGARVAMMLTVASTTGECTHRAGVSGVAPYLQLIQLSDGTLAQGPGPASGFVRSGPRSPGMTRPVS